jgi:hypothetical protein
MLKSLRRIGHCEIGAFGVLGFASLPCKWPCSLKVSKSGTKMETILSLSAIISPGVVRYGSRGALELQVSASTG